MSNSKGVKIASSFARISLFFCAMVVLMGGVYGGIISMTIFSALACGLAFVPDKDFEGKRWPVVLGMIVLIILAFVV